MKNLILSSLVVASAVIAFTGCQTTTRRYADGETRRTVAGFSEEDIEDTVSRAVQSILRQDRIKLYDGANRAVTIVDDVTNDTLSRGRDAGALAEALGQSLREELTNSGKIIVYNKEVGIYAENRLKPQYLLKGRLTERNLRQDNCDYQKEYNLNLTLIEIATGAEFWQKRIHVGKLVDKINVMN